MTDSLQTLFEETVKDMYNAEKQFLKAMPKLEAAATDPDLKEAIQGHIRQTEGHISRLQQVADILEIMPTGKVCQATHGLIQEAEENLREVQPGPVLDAAIIISAQKNEHYEICSYGTLYAWAKELDLDDVSNLLNKTLEEEAETNEKLTKIAKKGLNEQAKEAVSTTGSRATVR